MTDVNDIAFWYPPLAEAALPVPQTLIVTDADGLEVMLDGKMPDALNPLIAELMSYGDYLGWPCFLRTGHGSGKHRWADTCYVESPKKLLFNVACLVEWSHTVDFMGLPHSTWALRKFIPTHPLFICEAWMDFPVTREFRVFVRDGAVEHVQPYWPPDAVREGRPDRPWTGLLALASVLQDDEREHLTDLAAIACTAVGGGYWSVDLLQDRDGAWWITDMAEGERSFRWVP